VEDTAELERGRERYAARAWAKAHELLSGADRISPLDVDDLEALATCAYMLGHEREYLGLLERAHRAHRDAGNDARAARCAFWVGINLALSGEVGPASGWLGRARRLVDRAPGDGVERGYLLLPEVFEREAGGDLAGAAELAGEAAAIGERSGDADLFALAAHQQGHVLIRRNRVTDGLALLDEAMVAVTSGETSPIVSGIVYCGVILACQEAFDVRRAGEWTAALSRWCEDQPDLVAFTGRCRVHRAEIMQLHGAWVDALDEARRAEARSIEGKNLAAAGQSAYLQGEVHRLRGELAAAEEAYREASRYGREPQPGLALLRQAQGQPAAATGAIRRALAETADAGRRAPLLAAHAEISVERGDLAAAREACAELEEIAERRDGAMLVAIAASIRGAVDLAAGDAEAGLAASRRAARAWLDLEAPYEAARARISVGIACRALGDPDAAELELEAARRILDELGARVDLDRLESPVGHPPAAEGHGLTERELEVLRLVAAGRTNRNVASALVISEHTVARHLQNIFAKLGVSSRTAASAYAHEHDLA